MVPDAIFSRCNFPEDERKYGWLSMLLDAYDIVDRDCNTRIPTEQIQRGKKLACGKGCHNCCLNSSVPITPIEITGISWFASEKLCGEQREKVKKQLYNYKKNIKCPFLVDGECSIYSVRPIACRHLYVFGEKCKKGEDVFFTRPEDMMLPSREAARRASMKLLPHYGITKIKEQIKAFENGIMLEMAQGMHLLDWRVIYKAMILFEDNL